MRKECHRQDHLRKDMIKEGKKVTGICVLKYNAAAESMCKGCKGEKGSNICLYSTALVKHAMHMT